MLQGVPNYDEYGPVEGVIRPWLRHDAALDSRRGACLSGILEPGIEARHQRPAIAIVNAPQAGHHRRSARRKKCLMHPQPFLPGTSMGVPSSRKCRLACAQGNEICIKL